MTPQTDSVNVSWLSKQNLIRVVAAAAVLSTLSFAAGVAGDLSLADPTSGERVVLRIPPEIPPDAVRAAPLPPMTSTSSASEPQRIEIAENAAAVAEPERAHTSLIAPIAKPDRLFADAEPKLDPDRAPKPDDAISA